VLRSFRVAVEGGEDEVVPASNVSRGSGSLPSGISPVKPDLARLIHPIGKIVAETVEPRFSPNHTRALEPLKAAGIVALRHPVLLHEAFPL